METAATPIQGIRLFVYGTLRTGEGIPATVHGTLYDVNGAFPAAKLTDSVSDLIQGEIIVVPEHRIAATDRYEGYNPNNPATSYYIRRAVFAKTLDGDLVECDIYEFNADIEGYEVIESGDWREK